MVSQISDAPVYTENNSQSSSSTKTIQNTTASKTRKKSIQSTPKSGPLDFYVDTKYKKLTATQRQQIKKLLNKLYNYGFTQNQIKQICNNSPANPTKDLTALEKYANKLVQKKYSKKDIKSLVNCIIYSYAVPSQVTANSLAKRLKKDAKKSKDKIMKYVLPWDYCKSLNSLFKHTNNSRIYAIWKAKPTYGVDQGCIETLFDTTVNGSKVGISKNATLVDANCNKTAKIAIDQAKELRTWMMKKYNMSSNTASQVMSIMDSNAGICTYAGLANQIVALYMNKPAEFKKKFGFPLFIRSETGWDINDKKLLVDIFVFMNTQGNGTHGRVLLKDKNGKLTINSKVTTIGTSTGETRVEFKDTSKLVYLSYATVSEETKKKNDKASKYIQKYLGKDFKRVSVANLSNYKDKLKKLKKKLNKGKAIVLSLAPKQTSAPIPMIKVPR